MTRRDPIPPLPKRAPLEGGEPLSGVWMCCCFALWIAASVAFLLLKECAT